MKNDRKVRITMNKKDILEIKRRFKKEACTFTRMCGCYVDADHNKITKIGETFLNLEDDEAQRVQEALHLSDAETMEITHFERGHGLISTNNNNIMVEFKASPLEKDLITTDRRELREIVERKRREQSTSAEQQI
jgi:hypothetical protein